MNKKIVAVCLVVFLIGCAGGGSLAYANHKKGMEAQSLLASLSQTQDNWEVEQFIRAQEEQRPDGLEESQIATGSRYTGITYNNVSVASAGNGSAASDEGSNEGNNKEESGFLSNILNKKDNKQTATQEDSSNTVDAANVEETPADTNKTIGRVAIQSGSLNIRAAGSTDGEVIGQAYKDDKLEIIGQDGVWYQIITANGLQGYVSSTYVEIVK